MPRFKIAVADTDEKAIAKFAEVIGEIRLDQLPEERAGNGKSDRHTQAVIPIEIEIGDRATAQSIDDKFLENLNHIESFPEISTKPETHGYVEDYYVIGKNRRCYFYTRYTYQDISGKLRHHHISKKQTEAIAALWRSGASAKEICVAIGKKYLGKDGS
ncbi:hypothetical protein [Pseudanabaena yagii]|uniref:Uncharacterized protein n=1 Tax=Pseudanabaena yagii GIHE-NHR1 TaxID=2722753 RepID=A0ABX1LYP2_9CYAN|nr:hypothetical protein [Pseudanabaena yagii]NMF60071.1 hypothetical protein [Pseudanabaena yagii GIHE-NHR1]